ncbi:MAG: TatD family hydrolase [Desulfamplus sp.]|nr:TatD family hydrolase [Desulfamplus sp.]
MKLFDSHCHIDDNVFDHDFDEMLKRAEDALVKGIMAVGIDPGTTKKAIEMAEKYSKKSIETAKKYSKKSIEMAEKYSKKSIETVENYSKKEIETAEKYSNKEIDTTDKYYSGNIFVSAGMHPHYAQKCSHKIMEEIKELAAHQCVMAWGETGLDFNRMLSPQKDQERWFLAQMEAAGELHLPVIFHERDSRGRFLEMIQSVGPPEKGGVVHCFSGSKKEMFAYLDLGFHIGITGILTIKGRGAPLRELVPHIPDNRILIETDAPYLTPAPMKNRVRRNEPAFVMHVLGKLSEIKNIDSSTLADTIWDNTCKLYGIRELVEK